MTSKEIYLKKLGERIKKERTAKHIKQEVLARKVGLTKSEISRIENGKREIKLAILIEIAEVFEIKASALLED